jgi:acyl dehydratase
MSGKKWTYEDFEPGSEIVFGPRRVEEVEMIDFARQFDPQPMHLDREAGEASVLGALSASGLFTASVFMKMMCDAYILDSTSQGSPGIDFVNFRRPVFAGDELTGHTRVLSRRLSSSRPGLGFVKVHCEVRNQRDETVLEMENTGMFLLRRPEAA